MDEAKTENVMSVELSIRRELAYRQKLASFLLELDRQDLLPLRVPSSTYQGQASNPTLQTKRTENQFQSSKPFYHVPTPNQEQASNPTSKATLEQFQSPVPNSISNLYQNRVPSQNQAHNPNPKRLPRQHQILNSSVHPRFRVSARPCHSGTKRKEIMGKNPGPQCRKPRPSQPDYVTMDQNGFFHCNICEIPCSSITNLNQHLKGHKHKTKLQLVMLGEKSASHPYCELCQIFCTDQKGLQMHYNGQKHLSKLQASELGGEKNARRTCELCKIWCMNEDAFQQHLRGKSHVTRLYAVENRIHS